MSISVPGIIMAFREGMEAFLVLAVIIQYFGKTGKRNFMVPVGIGVCISILLSIVIGWILLSLSRTFESIEEVGELWESILSLIAVGIILTFLIWIIRNGQDVRRDIENRAALKESAGGIILLTTILIAREGVEVAIFAFAGHYESLSIFIGIALSAIMIILLSFSLIRVSLRALLHITLVYLILQSGHLLGYGIHEGLSALHGLGYLESSSAFLWKAYDLSSTILSHKDGILGVPLYILIGWYSKPEWIQFIIQYGMTIALLVLWMKSFHSIRKR